MFNRARIAASVYHRASPRARPLRFALLVRPSAAPALEPWPAASSPGSPLAGLPGGDVYAFIGVFCAHDPARYAPILAFWFSALENPSPSAEASGVVRPAERRRSRS